MTDRPPLDLKTLFGSVLLTAAALLLAWQEQAMPAPVRSPADAAIREYEAIRFTATPIQLCLKADEVERLYLRAADREGFRAWRKHVANDCAAFRGAAQ